MCLATAIRVDPANFWPKPKSANPKAVQMNLIMWLQLLLGFPFLAPRECSCYGERFFVMEYRDYLGVWLPLSINTLAVTVLYPTLCLRTKGPPCHWLILQQVRLGHAAAIAAVLPAVLKLELALLLISLPQDQLR